MHQRAVVQGHPGVQELGERLQFLAVGQFAGQEQVGGLFIAEAPPLFQDRFREVLQFITAIVQTTVDGFQGAILLALVTHDITDVGQTDQDTGSVLVAQSALHAVALEKSAVDTARKLDLVGQFVDKILLVHRFIYY